MSEKLKAEIEGLKVVVENAEAERDAVKAELDAMKAELEDAKAELEGVKAELADPKAIIMARLKERIPVLFDFDKFPVNQKQNMAIHREFLREALGKLLLELEGK